MARRNSTWHGNSISTEGMTMLQKYLEDLATWFDPSLTLGCKNYWDWIICHEGWTYLISCMETYLGCSLFSAVLFAFFLLGANFASKQDSLQKITGVRWFDRVGNLRLRDGQKPAQFVGERISRSELLPSRQFSSNHMMWSYPSHHLWLC